MAIRTTVIGAGLGGLAAAIHLAAEGREVTVFDSRKSTGGKAGEIVLSDGNRHWRFDKGPSLLTLPNVLDDLFKAAGKHREDYLEIVPLDPITRYWFPDGSRVESSPDRRRFAASLENAGIAGRKELDGYLDYSRRIWEITHGIFMERSLDEKADLLKDPKIWKSLFRLGHIDAFRTMDAAHRSFFRDPRAWQFFDRYATYNGSNPYRVPATLNIIPHVEYGIGAWAVKGGIIAIPRSLEKLAREMGVVFRLGESVERILSNRRRITGVRTAIEAILCDEVI
jgi:phytoene desaturase